MSNNKHVIGRPVINQPVLLLGIGNIRFGKNVKLGYFPSPFFYNGYIHIEARSAGSEVIFGDNVFINNNFFAISDRAGIEIGADTLIGINCQIIDSDFHNITSALHTGVNAVSSKVKLGRNVFLGNNVTICKGVMIGENTVVANGSVVTKSFSENLVIGGVPAQIIRKL